MANFDWWRWVEFYEDDATDRLSMNRLCTMIATVSLAVTFIPAVFLEYSIAPTLATILAGLGGFNYVAGRVTGAYTQVRMEQAKQGIPAPDPAPLPLGPTTTINVSAKPPEAADPTPDKRKGSKKRGDD